MGFLTYKMYDYIAQTMLNSDILYIHSVIMHEAYFENEF